MQRDSVTPYRLSNGRNCRTAGEVVDARQLMFLRGSHGSGTAVDVFLQRQDSGQKQLVSTIDEQRTIELMGEFDGVSGVTALTGTRGQGDGVGSEHDDMIGADDALVTKTEAASEIEAAGQSTKVPC